MTAVPDAGHLEPVTLDAGAAGAGPLTYLRGGEVGPPVVFLNALGQGVAPARRLLDELRPRRALTWVMRGVTAPHEARTVDGHVDDLAAVVAREAPDGCHLVAWCTGPKLALRFHARHPGVALSMTFLSPAFKQPGRDPALDTPYEEALESLLRGVDRRPEAAGRLRRMFAAGVGGGAAAGAVPPELADAVGRPFADDAALVAYARQHLAFWRHDALAEAAGARLPVLLVGAGQDQVVSPAGVRAAVAAFPAAEYVELPGAGHYALHDHADVVAGLVERTLAAAQSRPAA